MGRVESTTPAADPTPRDRTGENDFSQHLANTYLVGVYLAINAIADAYLLVDGPECVHVKTQFIQGNHDWRSNLTSVSGRHRVATTAVHPSGMTAGREGQILQLLSTMARNDAVKVLLLSSMPMAFATGVDYGGLCREVASQTGKQVGTIKGLSLRGDWLDGYGEALAVLARIIKLKKGPRDPRKIAVIGYLFDRNEGDHKSNLIVLKEMAEVVGLELASTWLEGGSYAQLTRASEADTIVSLPYGRKGAKILADRTGASLIDAALPFGTNGSERFLQSLAGITGEHNAATRYLQGKLSEFARNLEWLVPWLFQGLGVGFAGDPHLAQGFVEICELLGVKLDFLVVTNRSSHTGHLADALSSYPSIVHPTGSGLKAFLREVLGTGGTDLVVSNSLVTELVGSEVAVLELGFPSYYSHALFPRPFLGIDGLLAVVDRMANAVRQNELRQASRR